MSKAAGGRWMERWVALCLLLFPRRFRDRFGADLIITYQSLWGCTGPRWRCGLRILGDALVHGLAARWEDLGERFGVGAGLQRAAAGSKTTGRPTLATPRMLSELRHAGRRLRRRPLFAVMVVGLLAIGIGASSAILTVVHGVLVEPLHYREPDRLVRFLSSLNGAVDNDGTIAYLDLVDWLEQSEVFQNGSAYDEWTVNLTGVDRPERLVGALVSASFFELLGVEPALGRFFRAEEDRDGRDAVVVLSYGLWAGLFGGDNDVIGRSIQLNGAPHIVVGVAPERFEDPALSGLRDPRPRLWRPHGLIGVADEQLPHRGSHSWAGVARLATGISLEQAQAALGVVAAGLEREYPETNLGRGVVLAPLHDHMVGSARGSLGLLFAAGVLVLVIALVNVASLFLGRAVERSGEGAVRAALGASRAALLRSALTEGLLLTIAGTVLGLLAAELLIRIAVVQLADALPRAEQVSLGPISLSLSLLLGLGCGVAVSALPALRWSTVGFSGPRLRMSASARAGLRTRQRLVVAEVAVATLLLGAAAMLAQSLLNLHRVDPGVDLDNVLTFDLSLPYRTYSATESREAFVSSLLERVTALPGVQAAGTTNILPLSGGFDGNQVHRPELPLPAVNEEHGAQVRTISTDYLKAVGTTLLRGRSFDEQDRAGTPLVGLANQALAELLWGDDDPVGRRLLVSSAEVEVVGVVENVHHLSLREPPPPRAYLPRAQESIPWQLRRFQVVVRTGGPLDGASGARDPGVAGPGVAGDQATNPTLVPALRSIVAELDPELPIANLRTLRSYVRDTTAMARFRTWLVVWFAVASALLTAAGVYGVISYGVQLRRREIAVRLAVGAPRGRVRNLVLRQAAVLAAIGLILGGAGAAALYRAVRSFLENLLFGIDLAQVAAMTLLPVALMVLVLLASWLPARKACRIEPSSVLRDG